jgi:crotonobetainyl-CoA:carnitine CoA-transferase CaiB-like acyl-CoA transferase
MAQGALSGVRVLDLADETAVLGAKLLGDLGADVLRVEPPGGDPIRRLGPFAESPKSRVQSPKSGEADATLDSSLSHWWFNTGKRSVQGLSIVRRRM